MSRQVKVRMIQDQMSSTLRIQVEIPEVFTATHFFVLQEFEKVFMGREFTMSQRLHALAKFVARTGESQA